MQTRCLIEFQATKNKEKDRNLIDKIKLTLDVIYKVNVKLNLLFTIHTNSYFSNDL